MRIECLSNFSSVISLRADAFAINLHFQGFADFLQIRNCRKITDAS